MKVLVDTRVWSRLFRKSTDKDDPIVLGLIELIKEAQWKHSCVFTQQNFRYSK